MIKKPVHRFALQINRLVSIWYGPPLWKSIFLRVAFQVLRAAIDQNFIFNDNFFFINSGSAVISGTPIGYWRQLLSCVKI